MVSDVAFTNASGADETNPCADLAIDGNAMEGQTPRAGRSHQSKSGFVVVGTCPAK